MLINDVVGQSELKKRLRSTVSQNRISHAQLFSGKFGFGSLALAIAYCQYISCKNRTEEDSCGTCSSCLKFNNFMHPDLHFSFPYNTPKGGRKVETAEDLMSDWRALLTKNIYFDLSDWNRHISVEKKQVLINVKESQRIIKALAYKPFEAEYRFLIIWAADKLNVDAANKLLKQIEEPNAKTLIILITEKKESLLSTIISRTQDLRLGPIDEDKLIEALAVDHPKNEDLVRAAKSANGDLIAARRLLESNEDLEQQFNWFKAWMRACYKADIQAMHKWVDEISSAKVGRENRMQFLIYAGKIMRAGILKNYQGPYQDNLQKEEIDFVHRFAPYVHSSNIVEMRSIVDEAHYHISRNAYAKIVFMDLSMQFANLLHVKNVHL